MGMSGDFQIPVKLTAKQASLVMLVITLLAPYGAFIGGIEYSSEEGLQIDFNVMAATWIFFLKEGEGGTAYGIAEPGFHFLNRDTLPYLFFQNVFGFAFAIAVVLRCTGRISRRKTLIVGALTMFFPITNVLSTIPLLLELYRIGIDPLFYAGPIPIQLLIGLYIIRTSSLPESTSPWNDKETSGK
ncbi:MAG: hypothetical protein AM325_004670 [Candidatus Thorarchaeota archaeon SMTZ1-45]